jgi:hypothetical protein
MRKPLAGRPGAVVASIAPMYLVAIAWVYVVLMMALAEATSPAGSVLGAVITFVMYGVMPLSIVMYILHTPARRAARRQAEAVEAHAGSGVDPDAGSHPAGAAVTPERKEP